MEEEELEWHENLESASIRDAKLKQCYMRIFMHIRMNIYVLVIAYVFQRLMPGKHLSYSTRAYVYADKQLTYVYNVNIIHTCQYKSITYTWLRLNGSRLPKNMATLVR